MDNAREDLYKVLHYRFANESLLQLAMTHASMGECNYERLEFLGDALLDFVVGEYLYKAHPNAPEGTLTKERAQLVSNEALSRIFDTLQLRHLLVSQNLPLHSLSEKTRANFVESLVGAIYIDGGMASATQFVMRFVVGSSEGKVDYVSMLLEHFAARKTEVQIQESSVGTINSPRFAVQIVVAGKVLASAEGHSKKVARQEACRLAWEQLS